MTAGSSTLPGSARHETLRRPAAVRLGWLLAGVGLLVVLCAASLVFGARDVSITDLFAAFSADPTRMPETSGKAGTPATTTEDEK